MDIAALISWLVTATGGFVMLGIWIARGGVRQQRTNASRFPAPVIFGHFALAAAGLVVWIAYLVADKEALAWTAFGLLLPVALLGFVMLARWIPVYRAGPAAAGTTAGTTAAATSTSASASGTAGRTGGTNAPSRRRHTGVGSGPGADTAVPAERHFPVVVVAGHGLFAVVTLVLVLLAALGAGGG